MSSAVYFLHDPVSRAVKIGRSTDLPTRQNAAKTFNPNRLVLLGTLPGGRSEEKRLHSMFAAHRRAREWFNANDEVLTAIRELLVAGGSPRTVYDELHRRNKCRYGLQGVQVCRASFGLERWTVLHSFWGPHTRLMLAVYPSGGVPADRVFAKAEDCFLMSEWPIVCPCWLDSDEEDAL